MSNDGYSRSSFFLWFLHFRCFLASPFLTAFEFPLTCFSLPPSLAGLGDAVGAILYGTMLRELGDGTVCEHLCRDPRPAWLGRLS